MIKIAYFIDTIFSPVGGTEKQLLHLLTNLDRDKFTPILCTLTSSEWMKNDFHSCPLHVANITSFKKIDTWIKIWRLASFLKEEKVDVVQTFFSDANKVGIIAAKLAGVPLLISSRRNQGYWHTRSELVQIRIVNRWVDQFIVNSTSTREWLNAAENVTYEKIKVAYNGIDLSLFDTSSRDRIHYRQSLGIINDDIAIGMVANCRPIKGHDILLKAAQLVLKKNPKTIFFAVGDSSGEEIYINKLSSLTDQLGIKDRFKFLGPRNDVAQILQALDVGVLSSNSESFSNALGEYLAAGLPVVTTDVGGAQEAVSVGENGYIVPVGDYQTLGNRILDIISSGNQKSMRKVSRERAERLFSLTNMINRHEELYLSGMGHGNI